MQSNIGQDYWGMDCPERGPALSHIHGSGPGCEPYAHVECPCRYCNMTPSDFARRLDGEPKQIPAPPEEPEQTDDEDIRDVVNFHEAKYALGVWVGAWPEAYRSVLSGPNNQPWGRGRSWRGDGRLNPRDIMELEKRVVLRERALGYR